MKDIDFRIHIFFANGKSGGNEMNRSILGDIRNENESPYPPKRERSRKIIIFKFLPARKRIFRTVPGRVHTYFAIPIGSMYGIFNYIYHKFKPKVGKYSIHGAYGKW